MDITQVGSAIEAMLFASGEPVSAERLAESLETDKHTVQKIISLLMEKMDSDSFGITIVKLDNTYQMVTKKKYAKYVRNVLETRRNLPLSNASMETLSIIAYNQPVTRGYIEKVRGVDSSGTVSLLEAKGLIEERGRLDIPGRPIVYGTTLNFLRCFGLKSIKDLPSIKGESDPVKEAEINQTLKEKIAEPQKTEVEI